MPESRFSSYKAADEYARMLAKSKQSPRLRRDGDDMWLVTTPDVAAEPPVVPTPSAVETGPTPPCTRTSAEAGALGVRPCYGCGKPIPHARLISTPDAVRCVACQSLFEKDHDPRIFVDEGPAGTREGHKRMRGQLMSDMLKRGSQ